MTSASASRLWFKYMFLRLSTVSKIDTFTDLNPVLWILNDIWQKLLLCNSRISCVICWDCKSEVKHVLIAYALLLNSLIVMPSSFSQLYLMVSSIYLVHNFLCFFQSAHWHLREQYFAMLHQKHLNRFTLSLKFFLATILRLTAEYICCLSSFTDLEDLFKEWDWKQHKDCYHQHLLRKSWELRNEDTSWNALSWCTFHHSSIHTSWGPKCDEGFQLTLWLFFNPCWFWSDSEMSLDIHCCLILSDWSKDRIMFTICCSLLPWHYNLRRHSR